MKSKENRAITIAKNLYRKFNYWSKTWKTIGKKKSKSVQQKNPDKKNKNRNFSIDDATRESDVSRFPSPFPVNMEGR
jgi:hypothetical protein